MENLDLPAALHLGLLAFSSAVNTARLRLELDKERRARARWKRRCAREATVGANPE